MVEAEVGELLNAQVDVEWSGPVALAAQIRTKSLLIAADRLRLLARFADAVTAEAVAELASSPPVPGAPLDHEVIESAVAGEVQAVLGMAPSPATRLVNLGQRLATVLPAVLVALEAGRLDLTRARAQADAHRGAA